MAGERATGMVFTIEVDASTGKATLKDFSNTAKEQFGQIKSHGEGLTSTFGGVKTAITGVLAAIGAFTAARAFVGFMRESIDAAATQEQAEIRLANALQKRGIFTRELFDSLLQQANAMQFVIGVDDDAILRQQALAIQLGVTAEQSTRLVQVANDIAVVFGKDIDQVVTAVARSISANTTRAFQQLGIDVKEAGFQALDTAGKLKVLEDMVGGAAQASLRSYSGEVKLIGLAWGEFKETVGDYVVRSPAVQEALKGVLGIIRDMTDALGTEKGQAAVKGMTLALVDFTDAGILAARVSGAIGGGILALWRDITHGGEDDKLFGFFRDFIANQPALDKALQDTALRLAEIRKQIAAAGTTPLPSVTPGAGKGTGVPLGSGGAGLEGPFVGPQPPWGWEEYSTISAKIPDFEADIWQQILGVRRDAAEEWSAESQSLQMQQLQDEYMTALAMANVIGADTLQVDILYGLKRNAAEKRFADERVKMAKAEQMQKLAYQLQVMQAASGFIQTAFGEHKAGQYAATVINTAAGVMQALGNLPPPYSFAVAALIAATGAVQLRQIASTEIGGGGGGAASVGAIPGGATPTGGAIGPPAQDVNVHVYLEGHGVIQDMDAMAAEIWRSIRKHQAQTGQA